MKRFQNIALLAGGVSRRFWPLEEKNLLSFCGKPLLKHQLQMVLPYCEKLFIITNATNNQAIRDAVSQFGNTIEIVVQSGSGQDKAVKALKGKIQGDILIVNDNDVFEEFLFEDQLHAVSKETEDIMLVAKEMETYFPGGYLKHDRNSVLEVIEKPQPDKTPSSYVKLVFDYIRNFDDFYDSLQAVRGDDDVYEKALNHYINRGHKATFITYKGRWETLKYPWHVLGVSNYYRHHIGKNVGAGTKIHKTAVIEGNVYIGDNVTISEFTKIVGPTYIGNNTIVGTHAMIRESMIGADCLVGGYAEVTRSYLGNSVSLHRNYVGDSVLANNILVGGEAIFANFRFDEKNIMSTIKDELIDTGRKKLGTIVGNNVKIGVNASIMPGVKIGPNVTIAPHQLVTRDSS